MIEMEQSRCEEIERMYCRKRSDYLWGREQEVAPILLPFEFGNGRRLIALRPLITRTNYYVVAVDGRWDLTNKTDGPLSIYEHLDEIYDALEDYFGHCRCEDCKDDLDDEVNAFDGWPSPCFLVGTEWWELKNESDKPETTVGVDDR